MSRTKARHGGPEANMAEAGICISGPQTPRQFHLSRSMRSRPALPVTRPIPRKRTPT